MIDKNGKPDGPGNLSYNHPEIFGEKLSFNGPCLMKNGDILTALLSTSSQNLSYFFEFENGIVRFKIVFQNNPEICNQDPLEMSYIGRVKHNKRHERGKAFYLKDSWFCGKWDFDRMVQGE